jgi:hypothetical protein
VNQRVVRVQIPEYDVVFDDGAPIYVGAVIRKRASMNGPMRVRSLIRIEQIGMAVERRTHPIF